MELATLAQIRTEIDRRAALIGASRHSELPTYGHTEDGARPHIEVDSQGYHFVVVERGVERKRITSPDLEEIYYQVFRGVTHSLAGRGRRAKGEDFRRQLFRDQFELLAKLDPKWAARNAEDHRQILIDNPFTDK